LSAGVLIREEQQADRSMIGALHRAAFGGDTEAVLVDRLRLSDAFDPALSVVAVDDGEVVGHILLTRARIVGAETIEPALALAPMAVIPARQREGIGTRLMAHALDAARALGYGLVIVLGHPEYYPRFGFVPASRFGIRCPFEAPDQAFMALWLAPEHAKRVDGMMEYAAPFAEL